MRYVRWITLDQAGRFTDAMLAPRPVSHGVRASGYGGHDATGPTEPVYTVGGQTMCGHLLAKQLASCN